MDSLIAIVPSAGIGSRASPFGVNAIPKQYQQLSGIPVIRHTVSTLLAEPRIKRIIISISKNDSLAKVILGHLPRITLKNCGGKSRISTVINSLEDIHADSNDWILIHDAVRPGLPYEYLNSLINECINHPVGGLLALPVIDTIKKGARFSKKTINRKNLWLAQTPQMFRFGILKNALLHASENSVFPITDESSAIERIGYFPKFVRGSLMNIKITWPEDFRLVEKWL